MFPSATDLAFYQARRRPAWASRIAPAKLTEPSIDDVISVHAGHKRICTETHNMCAFVRGWLRRGEPLIERLEELIANPCGPNPRKRASLASKWLARIQGT